MRVCLVLALACLAAACGSTNVDDERQALIALDREWSQQVKDLDKFMAKWAAEGSLNIPGLPIATGLGPIRTTANSYGGVPGFSIRWSPAKADVGSSGDLGYTAGSYRLTKDDPKGTPVTETGKYVAVWKKDSGVWKAVEFIFNADAMPKQGG